MKKYTFIVMDSQKVSNHTLCLKNTHFYILFLWLIFMTMFSYYTGNIYRQLAPTLNPLYLQSRNELIKTKIQLAYEYTENLNSRAIAQNNQIERLKALTSVEQKDNIILLNDNYKQVSLDKEIIGNRLLSYKIKIGNRVLFNYFADNDKRLQKNEVEQKVADIKNNLQEIINNFNFNKKINIISVSDEEYLGMIGNLLVFYSTKQDALRNHTTEYELAEKYRNTLVREFKIYKDNFEVQGNPVLRKIATVPKKAALTEMTERLDREQNFIANIIKNDTVKVADLYGKTIEIQANFAKTPSVYPLFYSYITSPFAYRVHPLSRKHLLHSGIDFSALNGTRVISTADGRVSYSGWMGGYGNVVEINHGFGVTTLYAHCSKVYVYNGQRVKKNMTIALSGSSGLVEGPHLHYEVKKFGKSVDPAPYLNRDILTAKKDW